MSQSSGPWAPPFAGPWAPPDYRPDDAPAGQAWSPPAPEPEPEPETEPETEPEPEPETEPEPDPEAEPDPEPEPEPDPEPVPYVPAPLLDVPLSRIPSAATPSVAEAAPYPHEAVGAPSVPVRVRSVKGPEKRPLYLRLLQLKHLQPNAWQRALLGEGMILLGLLLAMADLASAWAIMVLPIAVGGLVKSHDVLTGWLAENPAGQPKGD